MHAFHFNKGGTDQTNFADAVYTKVTWSTVQLDTCSLFDNANDQIVMPCAGLLWMSVHIWVTNHLLITSGANVTAKTFKNGASAATPSAGVGSLTGDGTKKGTSIIPGSAQLVAAADVFDVRLYVETDGTDAVADGNIAHTYWAGMFFPHGAAYPGGLVYG